MATRVVTLYDPKNDAVVEVMLSAEDVTRAESDANFATVLVNTVLIQRAATTAQSQQGDGDNTNSEIEGNIRSLAQEEEEVISEETGLYRWSQNMVLLLLDNYSQHEKKFSSGKFLQKKIWEEIAQAMRTELPTITGPQCAAKMRSLKKTYKSIKDHNEKSGNDRWTWPFYEKMNSILAVPVAVASSSGMSTQKNVDTGSEVESESSAGLRKKENVVTLLKKRLRQKSEEEAARAKRHRERLEMDEKIVSLLTKLVDKT